MLKKILMGIAEAGFVGFLWIYLDRQFSTQAAVIGMGLCACLILWFHRKDIRSLIRWGADDKSGEIVEPPTVSTPTAIQNSSRIEIVRCERASTHLYEGFVVRNHGEPAFNIEISPMQVGPASLRTIRRVQSLTKDDGERHVQFELQDKSGKTESHSLFDWMRVQSIDAIDVLIKYQDWENREHHTAFKVERDVLAKGGLSFSHVPAGQSGLQETNISHLKNNQDRPLFWISLKQQNQILPMLRPFRDRKMAVFIHRASEDTKAIGKQLYEIIRASGINSKLYVGEMGVKPPPRGLSISATKQNADLAYILRAALAESAITNGLVEI